MTKVLTPIEKIAMIDKMTQSINNKYGKVVCGRLGASKELQEQLKIEFIPLPSPALNEALGGGIPRKKVTILSGVESSAKTGTMLETIAINQKNDPSFCALWLESEDSLDPDFMDMLGVDQDRFVVVMHDKERGAETCLDELLALSETGIFDLVVINSLKALTPKTELENSLTKDTMALQARMNSKLMRKLGPTISSTNGAIVLVNHLTTSIGGMSYGDPLVQSGGRAIRHWATMILDFRKMSILDGDNIARDEGMKIGCHVRKNRCVFNRNPYVKSEFFVVFGEGTEQILEVMQVALAKGILVKAGAWLREIDPNTGEIRVLPDGTELKFNGKNAFRNYCLEYPEYFADLRFRSGGGHFESLSEEEIAAAEEEELADQLEFANTEKEMEKEEKKATKRKKKEA